MTAYGAFVGLTAFRPALMDATPLAGIPLSVSYGMALIGGAFALAVGYAWALRGARE